MAADSDGAPAATPVTRKTLSDVKRRFRQRLPQGSDADGLADAWIEAVKQQAIEMNVSSGPMPTSLGAWRADLLMHVCLQLGRLVTERETEVLLRLSPTAARAVHRQMKATYEDLISHFVLAWAFRDAALDGVGEFEGMKGAHRVVFSTKDSMETAVAELSRAGIRVARKRDETNLPYLLYVSRELDVKRLRLPKRK